ncbi:hypothetical protein BsWGS_15084 [Bradybaena similaris]
MSSPRKSSKSPSRSRIPRRGKSSTTMKTTTRSRSRSRSVGRKPKSVAEAKEPDVAARRSPAWQSYSSLKASSGAVNEEKTTLTERTVVSALYSSESSSGQEHASVTPYRASSRIATFIEKEAEARKLPVRQSYDTSKASSGVVNEEVRLTKRTVTSNLYTSESSSGQEHASVTPSRASSRIAALIEKEKAESSRLREQIKSELLSNITTPPLSVDPSADSKERHYEFFGPFGAFLFITLMPIILIYVNFAFSPGKTGTSMFSKQQIALLFDVEATLIFLAWFFFHAFLAVLPVGCIVEGQPVKFVGRLKFRCNGILAVSVSLLLLGAAVYFQPAVTKVTEKFIGLMAAGIIFSFTLSACLFIKATFVGKRKLAPGGCTGNIVYDFFVGRELNPRIGMLDLKFFLQLRPGLIGWIALDWIMVVKAYQETATILPSLVLVAVFQTLYVVDALWFEDVFLATAEMTQDGCGFMMIFGSLAWLPFFYNLQPRYLYENSLTLPWYCLVPITLLQFVGLYIYRKSQLEKSHFRQDLKHQVVSGLYRVCRNPVYLGNLMLALSWSLTTGFGSIITYLYVVYLLILVVYRELRDDAQCRKKYGASWDRYCERVKYRIFPYIY